MMKQSGRILPSADTKKMSKTLKKQDLTNDIKSSIKEAIKEALENYFKIATCKNRTFDLKDEDIFCSEILQDIKLEIINYLKDKNIRFLDLDYYKGKKIDSVDENS